MLLNRPHTRLFSDDFDQSVFIPLSIEFKVEDLLPCAKVQPARLSQLPPLHAP